MTDTAKENETPKPASPPAAAKADGTASSSVGARIDRTRRTPFWVICQMISRFLTTVMFDLKLYGAYNMPKTGGVLLVSNHQSFLDPVLLGVRLDRTLSYFARSGLFKNRFLGWLIRSLNAFPVEQGAGDVGAVKEAITRLQGGHLLNVYPEGTRTEDGDILPLEKGVALVIRRAKVPVVPAVLMGSWEAWPRKQLLPHPHPVRIVYGPPMNGLWKLDRDEIISKIDQALRQLYADARAGRFPSTPKRPVGR